MIFGAQARSNKATLLIVGAVVFISVFVGLVYNHLDYWHVPTRTEVPIQADDTPSDSHKSGSSTSRPASSKDDLRQVYLDSIYNPKIKVDEHVYKLFGTFDWELPEKPAWTEPLGEKLCIIELDNRPFDKEGEIWGKKPMSWDKAESVHGLSTGMLNHWLYAKIHGYKYYYIEIEEYEDRRTSWKKPPIISEILKNHEACIYLDSDAIFHHLDLPFEWLMNYWDIHPSKNSLALALDPVADVNTDKFGKVYLNTGFIIAQNNEKTFEIMDAWQKCPEEDSAHPGCVEFRLNNPGRPTDQGGFGTYIRYDYAEDIKELPCTEANGFLESNSGCAGLFIKHLWTGKSNWIKVSVGEQLPGKFLEIFHEQFLAEKDQFFFTEAELMAGKANPKSSGKGGADLETE